MDAWGSFWRVFAPWAALVVIVGAGTSFAVERHAERTARTVVEERLARDARRLRTDVTDRLTREDDASIAAFVRSLAGELELRITIHDPAGRVRFDSHLDPSRLGDESVRPEVRGALDTGHARLRRPSVIHDRDTAYEALRLARADGTVLGVLRLSVPLESVAVLVRGVRQRFVLGGAAAIALGALFAGLIARRATARVAGWTDMAAALERGRYDTRVEPVGVGEERGLGTALNRLGEALTERVATLSEDDARLRAMLAAMVEGVVAVDGSDRVVFANHAACDLLGLDETEVIGRPMWQLLRAAELVRLLEEAHRGSRVVRREIVVTRSEREHVLEAHVSPLGDDAGGLVIVLHDVTELRRLERVRRDFVANVSHELKTPLTSIKGYVETLLEGALHDERHNTRFLEKIATHVERLAHLVTDLLSLARIESQQDAMPREPVDAIALVQRCVRRFEETARAKDISLRVDVGTEPVVVLGDAEAITQVVDNLLDNALKYTPGAGIVSARVERMGGMGRISVSDSGLGIPEDEQERIFERFYRVDKARSREVGGTGLGLSIVKHLVQAMQGNVAVESRLHEGSCFRVDLPLARSAAPRSAPRPHAKGDAT